MLFTCAETNCGDQVFHVISEPDHPTKAQEKHHEFVHWLVVNIPGTQINKGDEIIEYIGYRSFYEDKSK